MSIRELRLAQQSRVRKRVAINRIYDLHRNIKVKKVNASALLLHGALVENLTHMTGKNPELESHVICIQRFWRCCLTKKFQYGRRLLARKCTKDRLCETIMKSKYHGLQAIESDHLNSELMFMRENRHLEGYFWKQQINYAKDLETRGAKIEQRVF